MLFFLVGEATVVLAFFGESVVGLKKGQINANDYTVQSTTTYLGTNTESFSESSESEVGLFTPLVKDMRQLLMKKLQNTNLGVFLGEGVTGTV